MDEAHVKKQRAVFSCMHCSVLTDMIMFVRWRIPSENKLYVHKKLVNILYVRTGLAMSILAGAWWFTHLVYHTCAVSFTHAGQRQMRDL